MVIDASALVAQFPTFTDSVGFTDLLVDGSLSEMQLSILEGVFEHEGLDDLSSALGLLRDPAGIQDQRTFKATVYELVRRNETRIRELLARAQVSPGTQRFDPDPRAAVERIFGAGHRESPLRVDPPMAIVHIQRPSEEMVTDRQRLHERNARLASGVVAYGDGKRLAVAISTEALETKLAGMIARSEIQNYDGVLIANIHGESYWRRFNFADHSSRYLDKVAKIRTEVDNLSARRFVGFWFNLWWKNAVQRIHDSRNILALNVLETALVQYNAGRISYGALAKVIKTLDVVTKQDLAADIRRVFITDSFVYNDSIQFSQFLGNRVEWTAASLPRGVHVLVLEQVPLTTP